MTTVVEPRWSAEAEESLLGAMLLSPDALRVALESVEPIDFYGPLNLRLFAAMRGLYDRGEPIDATTVVDELRRTGEPIDDPSYLLALQANTPSISHTRHYATIVRREASARSLAAALGRARREIDENVDTTDVVDGLEEQIRSLDRGGTLPDRYWRSTTDYLSEDHSDVGVPLIEGVVNHHTRVVILATEKLGKSFWLRQFSLCAAAGIHPFTFKPIEPVRVLLLDAENDDDELVPTMLKVRQMVERVAVLGAAAPSPSLFSAPYGMDLAKRRDRSELEEVLTDSRPQLIVGGPIYKMLTQGDTVSDPRHAEKLQRIFDDVRRRWDCALMIEHHAPSGKPGSERELRSLGGQRWAAWPEVTIALRAQRNREIESAEVRYPHPPRGHYRWPRRFDRATRADQWPWTPVWRKGDAVVDPEPELLDGPFVEEPF